jgi:hypothetical protein
MSQTFEDYQDLADAGFQGGGGVIVAPEDEFFHSVYIAGQPRKNHLNITEETGKFQIRGVQYNLDEVNIIVTHTKDVLLKSKSEKGKDSIECFSFKKDKPWLGTSRLGDGSPRQCPQTSAERAVNDFCNPCRSQIIVSGIYCKADGSPILTEDKKPIFVFLRGKGMRYNNVSNYLNELFKEEFPALFKPVTEQTKDFEKRVVNSKRIVTKITRDQVGSKFGSMVNVFVLAKGVTLPDQSVLSILKLSQQTLDKFNEKFDWSKGKQASGYGARPSGVLDATPPGEAPPAEQKPEEEKKPDSFSFNFDNIKF